MFAIGDTGWGRCSATGPQHADRVHRHLAIDACSVIVVADHRSATSLQRSSSRLPHGNRPAHCPLGTGAETVPVIAAETVSQSHPDRSRCPASSTALRSQQLGIDGSAPNQCTNKYHADIRRGDTLAPLATPTPVKRAMAPTMAASGPASKKSRSVFGCGACKKRKIKCDEKRVSHCHRGGPGGRWNRRWSDRGWAVGDGYGLSGGEDQTLGDGED